jgi:hypothetical protein
VVLTIGIGAGAAGFYGLCLFMPLIEVLNGLSTG